MSQSCLEKITSLATTGASIATAIAVWFSYQALKATEEQSKIANQALLATQEQIKIANRQNELSVLPYISIGLTSKNDKNNKVDSVEISNITDNPALKVNLIMVDVIDGKPEYSFYNGSLEYISLSDKDKGERIISIHSFTEASSKEKLKQGLLDFYGSNDKNVSKLIDEKILDNQSSLYAFYLDLNGKVHVAIRDFEIKNGVLIHYSRIGHIP